MTLDKVRAVVRKYQYGDGAGWVFPPRSAHKADDALNAYGPHADNPDADRDVAKVIYDHISYMCIEILRMCDQAENTSVNAAPFGAIHRLPPVSDTMTKIMRWLGFVQGVLWVTGMKTLDELKTDNATESD